MSEHIHERRKHDAEIAQVKEEIKQVRDELSELKNSVDGLLSLWRDGVGAIRVIKFLAWLAASIGAMIAGVHMWGGK